MSSNKEDEDELEYSMFEDDEYEKIRDSPAKAAVTEPEPVATQKVVEDVPIPAVVVKPEEVAQEEEEYEFTDDEYEKMRSNERSNQNSPVKGAISEPVDNSPVRTPAQQHLSPRASNPVTPQHSATLSPKKSMNSSHASLPSNTPPTANKMNRSVSSAEKDLNSNSIVFNGSISGVQAEGSQMSAKSTVSKRSKKSASSPKSSTPQKNSMTMTSSLHKDSLSNNNSRHQEEEVEDIKDDEIADIMQEVKAMNTHHHNDGNEAIVSTAVRNELIRLSAILGVDNHLSLEPTTDELLYFLRSSVQKAEGIKYFANQYASSQASLHQGNDEDFPDDEHYPGRHQHQASSSSSARLREEVKAQKEKEQKLLKQTLKLEASMKASLGNVKEKSDWQDKYKRLMNKFRKEKEEKSAYEDFIKVQNKKMKVLVEHVEKLMKALKIENSKYLKMIHDYGLLKRDYERRKMQVDKQIRIANAQTRAIAEITEGSKVLEDQLKLMDEKYLELRAKLDVSRDYFAATVKKYRKESEVLRIKYAHANQGQLLDHVKLPKSHSSSSNNLKGADSFDYDQTMDMAQLHTSHNGSGKHGSFNSHPGRSNGGSPPLSPPNRMNMQVHIDDSHGAGKPSTGKQRPKSAYPTSSPSENQLYRSQSENKMGHAFQSGNRPKSASGSQQDGGYHSPSHHATHNLSAKDKEKQLGSIVRRIRQKSATGTKETWSAARLSELLQDTT